MVFAAYGYSFYLFLTWLPDFLVQSMHMSILKSAGFTAIPWICATIADLFVGGWLIDRPISRGYEETPVRKTVPILGILLGLAVFGATVTTDPVWAIVWISIALRGLVAGAPVGWSIPSLIAPCGGTRTISEVMYGLYRRPHRVFCRRVSDGWNRAGHRHRRLRFHPGPDQADRRPAGGVTCSTHRS